MRRIDVYIGKGGVGKSTLAVNLAGAYANKGERVCLVDTDTQQSQATIYRNTKLGFEVRTEIPKRGFDVVIVDYHPSYENGPQGDFVLVPLTPSLVDWEAFKRSKPLLQGKRFKMVVTLTDGRIKDDKFFLNAMREKYNALSMPKRNIYRRATADRKTVFQMERLFRADKARDDMRRIIKAIDE